MILLEIVVNIFLLLFHCLIKNKGNYTSSEENRSFHISLAFSYLVNHFCLRDVTKDLRFRFTFFFFVCVCCFMGYYFFPLFLIFFYKEKFRSFVCNIMQFFLAIVTCISKTILCISYTVGECFYTFLFLLFSFFC